MGKKASWLKDQNTKKLCKKTTKTIKYSQTTKQYLAIRSLIYRTLCMSEQFFYCLVENKFENVQISKAISTFSRIIRLNCVHTNPAVIIYGRFLLPIVIAQHRRRIYSFAEWKKKLDDEN